MIRVLIADSTRILRDGVKYLIEEFSCMKVVDTASNSTEVLGKCVKSKPDIVLMDLKMSDYNKARKSSMAHLCHP